MANIITRQCSNCLFIYMPSHYAACPQCAGNVPRKLRDQRSPMNAGGHRYFIETCASNPEVVGFRTCRTEACEKDHCRHVPQLLTVRAALALCALPCRHARDCYGYLQVVFKDELTPEQLTQIEADI